jgi:predicted nucleic acid-binding protein
VEATLVDSNVLLDCFDRGSEWFDWSAAMLSEAANRGRTVINPMIYAEVSVGFARIEDVETALPRQFFVRADLPWEAAFLAGRIFREYRRKGGLRRSPPPDFFIGAHATISGMRLLTRDARRYRAYFPKLEVIAP